MKTLVTTAQKQANDTHANRRSFLKGATAAGLGLTGLALMSSSKSQRRIVPRSAPIPGPT